MLKLYVMGREKIRDLLTDEDGASLAEYALLIALVLVGVVVAVQALTTAESGAINAGSAILDTAAAGG